MLSEMQIVEREFARRPPVIEDQTAPAPSVRSRTPMSSRPVRWLHAMTWVLSTPSAAVLLGRS